MESNQQLKQSLRQEMRDRRNDYVRTHSVDKEAVDLARLALTSDLLPEKAVIGGYWPIQSEVEVQPLLKMLVDRGYTCGLPVVTKDNAPLIFREWQPDYALVSDRYTIMIPDQQYPEIDPDVLLIPLLAFDFKGNRLGQGVGYYDQTLAFLRKDHHITAIGIAFDCQEIDSVPSDAHDQPLNCILTPTRCIWISK